MTKQLDRLVFILTKRMKQHTKKKKYSETDFSSGSDYDEFVIDTVCGRYPAAVSV